MGGLSEVDPDVGGDIRFIRHWDSAGRVEEKHWNENGLKLQRRQGFDQGRRP
jgi:hypothetical protein